MLRTRLDKAYLKRTIRPLYGWTQATPTHCFLDPAWDRSFNIWPGMGMKKTLGDNVTLVDATGSPYGLAALYVGGDGIDEILDQGVNAFAVWRLEPDAEFEIDAPAFDSTQTWTDPGDGTHTLVHVNTGAAADTKRGKLTPAGTTHASTSPIARLIKVNSATTITIGGLQGTV
jgi:hypothetical protein